jgi:hypothetical protein
MPPAEPLLAPWSNFYVIAGSSAGALTGLMFVVITLLTGVEHSGRVTDGIGAFTSPSVVHLCVALVVSAILTAPWHSVVAVSGALGVVALYGIIYMALVWYRTIRQTVYEPELSDWVWYSILPSVAYLALAASTILFVWAPDGMLFALAGAVLLLIVIGLRNAWDIVTFVATGQLEALGVKQEKNTPP